MLKSSLYEHSDAYILVKGTVLAATTLAADADPKNTNTKIMLKYSALFKDCINGISHRQIDSDRVIFVAMSMYNLLEYSDNY